MKNMTVILPWWGVPPVTSLSTPTPTPAWRDLYNAAEHTWNSWILSFSGKELCIFSLCFGKWECWDMSSGWVSPLHHPLVPPPPPRRLHRLWFFNYLGNLYNAVLWYPWLQIWSHDGSFKSCFSAQKKGREPWKTWPSLVNLDVQNTSWASGQAMPIAALFLVTEVTGWPCGQNF